MFYSDEHSNALRFGDVLQGFVKTVPIIEKPMKIDGYTINIELSKYFVVMDPCCQIGHGSITLSPLIELNHNFFKNDYFVKDLTNINRLVSPENSVPKKVWEDTFDEEERQRRIAEGEKYAFNNYFLYEKNDLFDEYTIKRKGNENIETNYYMVDFRNIYRLECRAIQSAENAPLNCKIYELDIKTREELRFKISAYFFEPAEEDLV